MKLAASIRLTLICLAGLLSLNGCSPSPKPSYELKAIALQYHLFHSSTKASPESQAQLLAFEDQFGDLPGNQRNEQVYRTALNSGKYTVVWSLQLEGNSDQNAGIILAYERETPKQGGWVVLANGSTRRLSQQEFAEAQQNANVD